MRDAIDSSYYNLLYLITLIIAICCNYNAIKSQDYLKYLIIFIIILNLISTLIKKIGSDYLPIYWSLITLLIHLIISIFIIIAYWGSLKYSLIIVLLLPIYIIWRIMLFITIAFIDHVLGIDTGVFA